MKYWLAVLNMIASALVLFYVSILYNQVQVNERDFQSEVLATAIDYSNGFAFANSLKYSSLDQDYDELQTLVSDPTNILRDFEIMMCCCYNMSLTEENLKLVESCIDGGVLCDSTGYYVLTYANDPILIEGNTEAKGKERDYVEYDATGGNKVVSKTPEVTNNTKKDLRWTLKLPYVINIDDEAIALNITNGDTIVYKPSSKVMARNTGMMDRITETRYFRFYDNEIPFTKILVTNHYMNHAGTAISSDKLNDKIKIQRINNILATALNESIKDITEVRGKQMNYTVYLPSSTTQSGVNPVKSNTLLISMSKASFAGQYAHLSEPVLSGFRAVSKEYIAGYIDEDGAKRYCYASQLPTDINREEMFYSMYDAMMAGYKPDFKYIHYPLMRELQTSE